MVPEQIAIVGASARAAAYSAQRSGFAPLAADLFADADLQQLCVATPVSEYPAGLARWLEASGAQSWLYTGALENYPELVDRMARAVPLLGNSGDRLRAVRCPHTLEAALREAGLPFPETRASAAGLPSDGSWLKKTYRASCGSGVRLWDAAAEADHAANDPAVFQRRLAGSSISATFVAHAGGATLLGIAQQLVGTSWTCAARFQHCGAIAPWPVSEAVAAQIERVGRTVSRAFALCGLFGVDMLLCAGDAFVVEVNPRYTASVEVIERATGVAAIKQHVAACRGVQSLQAPDGGRAVYVGKAILFADRPLRISDRFCAWCCQQAARQPWPMVADIPPAGTRIPPRHPICSVFVEGRSGEAVTAALEEAARACRARCYLPQ